MTEAGTPALLGRLSEIVRTRLGLNYPKDRWGDLQRGVRAATRELGFDDTAECLEWLVSAILTHQQIEILASHLTVGETYFFREKGAFQLLEERVLPALAASRRGGQRRLRIWSAGCCSGEETYSLAISLLRTVADIRDWDALVLGTDINGRFLEKAEEGVYGEWSFRGAPPDIKEHYFTRTQHSRYQIIPRVRELVRFSWLNLADVADAWPPEGMGAMDIIFCRNVLIYLAPEQGRQVVTRLCQCLAESGWLFVGAAETSIAACPELSPINMPGCIAYRKTARGIQTQVAPPPPTTWNPRSILLPDAPGRPPPPAPPLISQVPRMETAAPKLPAQSVDEPEEIEAALRTATSLAARGRHREVVDLLTEAATRGETTPEALTLLARACANGGDLDAALEWCDQAIAAAKASPSCYYLRATILQEKGEPAAASASLRNAVYLDPDFIMAHVALAHLARQRGDSREAARHWNSASVLLARYPSEEAPPESDGMTAGHLAEVVRRMLEQEAPV